MKLCQEWVNTEILVCAICSGVLVFLQAKCNASFRKHEKSSQLKMGIDDTGFNWTEALNCSHKRYELEEQKTISYVGM